MQQWPPATDEKRTCGNCGAHVSETFRRGYGSEGKVYACPSCTTYRELENDAGDRA